MQERESCHWITIKGIMLSCNNSEEDKHRCSPLYVESRKAELIETELPGAGGRGMGDGGQRAQISNIRRLSSGDLMHSPVTTVNNTWNSLGE